MIKLKQCMKIRYACCRFFLPPIILYAGLSVRKKAFFRNLPTIACLGMLGTYIAFAFIAFTLYAFRNIINITLAVSAFLQSPDILANC